MIEIDGEQHGRLLCDGVDCEETLTLIGIDQWTVRDSLQAYALEHGWTIITFNAKIDDQHYCPAHVEAVA